MVHSSLSHRRYKHVFDIQTKDRTYYLVAATAEEMENWVRTLCQICGFQPTESKGNMLIVIVITAATNLLLSHIPFIFCIKSNGTYFSKYVEN